MRQSILDVVPWGLMPAAFLFDATSPGSKMRRVGGQSFCLCDTAGGVFDAVALTRERYESFCFMFCFVLSFSLFLFDDQKGTWGEGMDSVLSIGF